MSLKAVNWNREEDQMSLMFYRQQILQFWTEEEIVLSSDLNTWNELSSTEKETYKRVLGGLTLLDTQQGGEGMPLLTTHVEGLQKKAVLALFGAMEQIHAKSYSSIFTTLVTEEENDEIFRWVEQHPLLQKKAGLILKYYHALLKPEASKEEVYLAMVASVFLESFLFYSGFFYPLYLAGQGKLTASGEIISLILRDEAIHGVYTGLLAQELLAQMPEKQARLRAEVSALLEELYEVERAYTAELYDSIGLTDEVIQYVEYNANKALMNLGLDPVFADPTINPIVENGIKTDTKTHDFFSTKGNGYVKALNVEKLTDDDFLFA
ncbi:class 1b ribonucleoside-diphosphate reductase subunit beta [Mechercharimyces sp. CAU 1602]|uniref:class 1b ribonucleoside-diphosphate reductase subunit beta n=1 Tax=Mechercharimyces sp. CAU 1602 TaxID=2973933 RepID=UPI0021615D4C|nr:class 1b ribonucleoside-diphosphate reductase subunit beta [Mechercharimyces sp. CAU 1602]MCS1350924.1 class 1b ribonucleoside-diphosphate reductase subunit beta [Mechercharimyces sp. CAU 1602]